MNETNHSKTFEIEKGSAIVIPESQLVPLNVSLPNEVLNESKRGVLDLSHPFTMSDNQLDHPVPKSKILRREFCSFGHGAFVWVYWTDKREWNRGHVSVNPFGYTLTIEITISEQKWISKVNLNADKQYNSLKLCAYPKTAHEELRQITPMLNHRDNPKDILIDRSWMNLWRQYVGWSDTLINSQPETRGVPTPQTQLETNQPLPVPYSTDRPKAIDNRKICVDVKKIQTMYTFFHQQLHPWILSALVDIVWEYWNEAAYEMIPFCVWNHLRSWYGGGPEVRLVGSLTNSFLSIEDYPLSIEFE